MPHAHGHPMSRATQSAKAQIRSRTLFAFIVALVAAGAILFAAYPGFMSFDSFLALHEARTVVTGGDYPPFASYVWRIFDAIWAGPSLMLFAQNFLLILSYATVARLLGVRSGFIAAGVVLFCLAPPILGPMLVVWKDVGVSACLCAATACVLALEPASNRRFMIAAAIMLLFFGAAYRMNAITAVLPLTIWLFWRGAFAKRDRNTVLAASAATFVVIAAAVVVVNGYRFPSLTRLPVPVVFRHVLIHDMAAMTAFTGKNLLPTSGETHADAAEYFRRIYDPRHINIEFANDREGRLWSAFSLPATLVYSSFLSAVRTEPRAYIARRIAVFREIVGAKDGPTFIPTHPGVDANDEGVSYHPTRVSEATIAYIIYSRDKVFGKPWFYYLVGTVALAIVIMRRDKIAYSTAIAVYASGAFYLLPLFFIAPAADTRYNHWPIVCMFIVVAAALRPAGRPRDVERTEPEPGDPRVELPA
jgi:hypothetical protein